jgi:hypothetical protein
MANWSKLCPALAASLLVPTLARAQTNDPTQPPPATTAQPPAPTAPPPAPVAPPPAAEPAPAPYPSAAPTYVYYEPPPPPRHHDLEWSIRFNPLDLVFGSANLEVERALPGPFSVTLGGNYIFADPMADSSLGLSAKGAGAYGELGYWMDGVALRGWFIKAHAGYNQITLTSDIDQISIPQYLVGGLFGAQSIIGGWFTYSWGIGVAYDLNAKDRYINVIDTTYSPPQQYSYKIPRTGPLHNGFDILTQLSIGGSF